VTNCIIWGGTAPVFGQISNIVLNSSDVQGLVGSMGGVGNFSADPRVDSNGHLLSPSPCIDSGNSAALPAGTTTDLFGQPRIVDDPGMPNNGPHAPVDIGAFEFQGTTCYANCDGSAAAPVLNVSDFACFLGAFATASPYANCDGSTSTPRLNILDFNCFLQRFNAGCP
jgi:hypothetical protein